MNAKHSLPNKSFYSDANTISRKRHLGLLPIRSAQTLEIMLSMRIELALSARVIHCKKQIIWFAYSSYTSWTANSDAHICFEFYFLVSLSLSFLLRKCTHLLQQTAAERCREKSSQENLFSIAFFHCRQVDAARRWARVKRVSVCHAARVNSYVQHYKVPFNRIACSKLIW